MFRRCMVVLHQDHQRCHGPQSQNRGQVLAQKTSNENYRSKHYIRLYEYLANYGFHLYQCTPLTGKLQVSGP